MFSYKLLKEECENGSVMTFSFDNAAVKLSELKGVDVGVVVHEDYDLINHLFMLMSYQYHVDLFTSLSDEKPEPFLEMIPDKDDIVIRISNKMLNIFMSKQTILQYMANLTSVIGSLENSVISLVSNGVNKANAYDGRHCDELTQEQINLITYNLWTDVDYAEFVLSDQRIIVVKHKRKCFNLSEKVCTILNISRDNIAAYRSISAQIGIWLKTINIDLSLVEI
ncbi:hypothetical protein EIJ81_00615 (plasmid) [Aliivibrio salmonicida]|uniref:hypothetical protein n=1 Tax=Aliivibrio salmonicida TaxID=40269 RepID=UPI000F6E284F|nr:hypothetical protein [Aliivibrio salmonicida]AZL83401.1 hypothetical protein EIJ81_00615 [Aliivibrio salmonicida]